MYKLLHRYTSPRGDDQSNGHFVLYYILVKLVRSWSNPIDEDHVVEISWRQWYFVGTLNEFFFVQRTRRTCFHFARITTKYIFTVGTAKNNRSLRSTHHFNNLLLPSLFSNGMIIIWFVFVKTVVNACTHINRYYYYYYKSFAVSRDEVFSFTEYKIIFSANGYYIIRRYIIIIIYCIAFRGPDVRLLFRAPVWFWNDDNKFYCGTYAKHYHIIRYYNTRRHDCEARNI